MKISTKFTKIAILFIFLLITLSNLYSCFLDKDYTSAMKIEFIPPENAEISVSNVKVKGFTLDWTDVPGGDYEYAIAASHNGNIEDYETSLEQGNIVLDFTPAYMLNGTYEVTKLIAGKEYKIKLFVRASNVEISEYLTAKVTLPYLDDAELLNVWINGQEAIFDGKEDSYSHYYLAGQEADEYSFTYQLMRGSELYINGEKVEDEVIKLTPYEALEVTAVNAQTEAVRDYIIYVGGRNNGIPLIVINTPNGRLSGDKYKVQEAHMTIIDNEQNSLGIGLYDGPIEIRGRGNSSWGMPKKGYNIYLSSKTQLLDMAPSTDWLIMANYADKSLMRNYTAYEFSRDLGAAFSPKMRFVDMILNGEYVGTYVIGERPKIDEGRLDLPKIKADTTDEYELTGTYMLLINNQGRLRGDEITFTSTKINRGQSTIWGVAEGDVVVIEQPGADNLSTAAYEYIRDYFNAAEDALFSDNFKDPEKGYRAYLDTASFIDWYLISEWYKNVDGDFRLSTFLYKPRGDKLYMGPVWDFDLGAGNADYRSCDNPRGWYIRTSIWFERLFEDEAFAQEFKDRWNYLKDNGYFDTFFKRIDDTAAMLEKSAEMNFQKWDILGSYVWPNANNVWERTTYQSEIDYLKEWLRQRFEWMDYEINTVKTNAEDESKLDKAKYPYVRFGETSNILLLEVEWHTSETYSEYIEEFKNTIPEESKEQYNGQIRWMEENLRLLKRNRYYEPRLINGKNLGNYFNHRDQRDISRYFNKDGYYMFRVYPYDTYVVYNNEDGEFQYKSFGTVSSKQEYEYVLTKEIIPLCDELLEKGLITQESYDFYTTKYPLDVWVERFFSE